MRTIPTQRIALGGLVSLVCAAAAALLAPAASRPAPDGARTAAGAPEAGPSAAQRRHPVDGLALYLAGVHVMKDDIREWWDAHHYCEMLRPDLIQCAVYDTTTPGAARLNAVEYIVPDEVYRGFPPEEREYWHPHAYEVDGGLLDVPELPADSARTFLRAARTTWGKTWHLWQTQRNARYPTGRPELAWSIEGPDSVPPGVRPRGNVLTGRPPRR